MKYSKREIMDSNKFKRELITLKLRVEKNKEERDYANWVERTNILIAETNRRIRSIKD